MAKKVTFLLAFMFVMIIASVTAFAAGTDSTAPVTGITEEKKLPAEMTAADYEEKYKELFFGEDTASKEEFVVNLNVKPDGSSNPLRYAVLGSVIRNELEKDYSDNPVIILLYIKIDRSYIPLFRADTKEGEVTNMIQGSIVLSTKVDLLNLGADKVNDVRVIAFKKKDAENLTLKNTQIRDLSIVVVRKSIAKGLGFGVNEVINAIKLPEPPK